MKKLPIMILSTVIMGLVLAPKAEALTVDNDGNVWYEVSELLEYKKETDRELEAICQRDARCYKEVNAEKIVTDDKYYALYALEIKQFAVTAINRQTETVKIVYFDENILAKFVSGSEITRHDPDKIYVGWFESENDKRNFNNDYPGNPFPYHLNNISGAHMFFGRFSQNDGFDWLSEYSTEVEFPMAENSLIMQNSGSFSYQVDSRNGFGASGTMNYSTCLNSPDFSEAAGCKLMVSSTKGLQYFAVESNQNFTDQDISVQNLEDQETNPQDPSGSEDQGNGSQNYEDSSSQETNSRDLEQDSEQTPTQAREELTSDTGPINQYTSPVSTVTLASSPTSISSPNTGANTIPCHQTVVEFPWWIIAIMLLGNVALLWLFWPKAKKSPKKSIDKPVGVR